MVLGEAAKRPSVEPQVSVPPTHTCSPAFFRGLLLLKKKSVRASSGHQGAIDAPATCGGLDGFSSPGFLLLHPLHHWAYGWKNMEGSRVLQLTQSLPWRSSFLQSCHLPGAAWRGGPVLGGPHVLVAALFEINWQCWQGAVLPTCIPGAPHWETSWAGSA